MPNCMSESQKISIWFLILRDKQHVITRINSALLSSALSFNGKAFFIFINNEISLNPLKNKDIE